MFDGYEKEKLIDKGGYAEVYEATCLSDGKRYAIKRLKEDYKYDDSMIRRFDLETRIQMKLTHPHITPIIQVEPDDKPPWFVMPLAECNLEKYLNKHGHGEHNLWIFQQILDALEFIEKDSSACVHRDLKPSNILLFREDNGSYTAKITDFGLARLIQRDTSAITKSSEKFGTEGYFAPELYIVGSQNATIEADIYSLGKILYVLLTGHGPSHIYQDSIPEGFKSIILKATEENPKYRFQSITEMKDKLYSIIKSRTVGVEEYPNQDKISRLINDGSDTAVSELIDLFLEKTDNSELILRGMTALPRDILGKIYLKHASSFISVFSEFDRHIEDSFPKTPSGNTDYDFCDRIADLYAYIFRLTDKFKIRRMIVRRLALLAHEKHRYYVGEIFSQLVDNLHDKDIEQEVVDVFSDHPEIIDFHREYLEKVNIPIALRKLL